MFTRLVGRRLAPVGSPAMSNFFHTTAVARASVFGNMTKPAPVADATPEKAQDGPSTESEGAPAVKDDETLSNWRLEEAQQNQITAAKFITPLKRELFAANVAANGFFKNHHAIELNGKTYKLLLTPEEIEILEPLVYVTLYRIKLSMKKATVVNRFVRGLGVKAAINQLHFNPKKMSTELEQLLKRGLDQATELGLNADGMYIHAVWVGLDGGWRKRVDIKGRGRMGVIHHPYVHLKAVLKSEQTKMRREWEKQQQKQQAKPRMFLNNEPLNFKVRGFYKW